MREKEAFQLFTQGLTSQEVELQKQRGFINTPPRNVTKSNIDIIRDNVCTLFNFLNFLIGVALAYVGAYANIFYLLIIITNILIGIIQEIHAKNLVAKLSLISSEKACVIRDGSQHDIAIEEIVKDDVMLLSMGDQISVDAQVIKGEIEVNESLLTGEADVIVKNAGDRLLSGSFVIGGKAYAIVREVGSNSFSSKIIEEVKKYKGIHSELLDAIAKVSRFTGFVIIPFGIILFLQAYYLRDNSTFVSIVTMAAALLGMLPKGLVLLIGISSATGVIKLSKKNVLVQEMHSMETFAHVDLLCLDKTGTITEGNMKVIDVKSFQHDFDINQIMSDYVAYANDNNATFTALQSYFKKENTVYQEVSKVPFTSQRKWGSITFDGLGSIVIGAPEKLVESEQLPLRVMEAQQEGIRVLLIAHTQAVVTRDLPPLTIIGMIELDDPIRKHASATFQYFKEEGVEVKIISGDNPVTVSNVARKAGLDDHNSFIDLSMVEDEELETIAFAHSVFGRVSPNQKKRLVEIYKNHGHVVAMSGDGVNDVLALREADCSIAMAEGNAAAKQVSQLVLLNSDFSMLKLVLLEGRRIINNVTKVSSIFFIKTIYSILLTILCIIANVPFPFIPLQITLIDIVIEGYPSFFLSFEADDKRITKKYLPSALSNALPYAIVIIVNILVVFGLQTLHILTNIEALTVMYSMIGCISIFAVWKACQPFHKLRLLLFISVVVIFITSLLVFQSILQISFQNISIFSYIILYAILSGLFLYGWNKIKK